VFAHRDARLAYQGSREDVVAVAADDKVREVLHLELIAAAHLAAQLADGDLHLGELAVERAAGASSGHHLRQRLRLVRLEGVVHRHHLGEAFRQAQVHRHGGEHLRPLWRAALAAAALGARVARVGLGHLLGAALVRCEAALALVEDALDAPVRLCLLPVLVVPLSDGGAAREAQRDAAR
jgi:hypothetical protein